MVSTSPARRRRALRGGVLVAAAALVATLVPGTAAAATTKVLNMSQTFEFEGQKWKETITAIDGATDSVSVSLAKSYKKTNDDGKVIYNLRETQSWNFSSLEANSVEIASNLTATINLGEQHPGLFEADIDLVPIDGKSIDSSCNNKLKRRVVQKSGGSTMSLHTGNEVFGNVTTIPQRATVTVNNGCSGGGGGHALTCPVDGEKGVAGTGFDFSGGTQFFSWSGSTTGLNTPSQQEIGSTPGFSHMAFLSGKVAKDRITVANDLSTGSVDAANLPRLSGQGTVTEASNQSTSGWSNCGSGKEYRTISKSSSSMGGDLTFTPTGEGSMSSGDPYDSESGTTSKMDVRNR